MENRLIIYSLQSPFLPAEEKVMMKTVLFSTEALSLDTASSLLAILFNVSSPYLPKWVHFQNTLVKDSHFIKYHPQKEI